ncbi:MAG: hypothetical protein ACKO3T_25480 [Planctomycetaceae bacterium]
MRIRVGGILACGFAASLLLVSSAAAMFSTVFAPAYPQGVIVEVRWDGDVDAVSARPIFKALTERHGLQAPSVVRPGPENFENLITKELNAARHNNGGAAGAGVFYFRGWLLRRADGACALAAARQQADRTMIALPELCRLLQAAAEGRRAFTVVLDLISEVNGDEFVKEMSKFERDLGVGKFLLFAAVQAPDSFQPAQRSFLSSGCETVFRGLDHKGFARSSVDVAANKTKELTAADLKAELTRQFRQSDRASHGEHLYCSGEEQSGGDQFALSTRPRGFDELVDDAAEHFRRIMDERKVRHLAVLDPCPVGNESGAVEVGKFELLRRVFLEKFQARLQESMGGALQFLDSSRAREILIGKEIGLQQLIGSIKPDVLGAFREEMNLEAKDPLLVLLCQISQPGQRALASEMMIEVWDAAAAAGNSAFKRTAILPADDIIVLYGRSGSQPPPPAQAGPAAEQADAARSLPAPPASLLLDPQFVQSNEERSKRAIEDAKPGPGSGVEMLNSNLLVELFVKGKRLPVEKAADLGSFLVKLKQGDEYIIRVTSNFESTVILRLLVDGLNTLAEQVRELSGERKWLFAQPRLLTDARFWVIPPGQWEIKGFYKEPQEKGETDCQAFLVTDIEGSQAARLGLRQNVGMITAAFYTAEKRKQPLQMGDGENLPRLGTVPGRAFTERVDLDSVWQPGTLIQVQHIRY